MGVWEIAILLAALGVVLLLMSRRSGRGRPVPPAGMVTVTLPAALQDRVRDLCARDQRIRAVKELREASGLSLLDAKRATDAIAAGQRLPTPPADGPPPADLADLADRARALRTAGQEAQAVQLVSTETGMSAGEAETFVRSLR